MASQDHGIHSCEEFVPEGSDYLQQTLGRVHTRWSSSHNKRKEDWSNWRCSSHVSKKIPQAMRIMKNSILEEPLIHLSIWIRNDDVMNEKDDEAEWSRRILPTKWIQDKCSIVISWYCFVMHLIIFSWCVVYMHVMGKELMVLYKYPLLLI